MQVDWSCVQQCILLRRPPGREAFLGGYVNFEVKHPVSLHFYNTQNFCIESSNGIKFVGGERLLDL